MKRSRDFISINLEKEISAFCVSNIEDGRIAELGYCNLSDLKELVIHLTSVYKMVVAKNIDLSYDVVLKMLLSIGFKQIARQYEMAKVIDH